jgi:NADPH:quinone reductase-like Zn-dependent oxidoreductase
MMKAIVQDRYGAPDVLALREVERPSVGPRDVLIEVRASAVNSGDARLRAMRVPGGMGLFARLAFGLFAPRTPTLGAELSGVVREVGSAVTRWRAGDEVFALSGMRMGAHAEFCALPEDACIARKPAGLPFADAAALAFGGTTALDFFRRAKLAKGEELLVYGASGAVGTAAIQLAHHAGARVTAVCSAGNAALVRELGADRVIDYRAEDFTKSDARYDVVMETVGALSFRQCERVLRPRGRLLLVSASMGQMLSAPWFNATTDKRVIAGPVTERVEDVEALAHMVAAGTYRAVIDRRYTLEQIAEAHTYVDTGRKKGSVVVTIG